MKESIDWNQILEIISETVKENLKKKLKQVRMQNLMRIQLNLKIDRHAR